MENLINYFIKNEYKLISEMESCKKLINFNNDFIEWRKYIRYDKNKYSKNIIFRNKSFEIILISWLPRHHSRIHSHPENGCIMKVLYGELFELRKDNDIIIENKYKENQVTFMHNKYGKHIISNISNKPAISLHVYSPPNYY